MPKVKLEPGIWVDLGINAITGQARAEGGTVQVVAGIAAPTTIVAEDALEFFQNQLLVFDAPVAGNLYASVTRGTGSINYYSSKVL